MGLYIKGMEMPTDGFITITVTSDGRVVGNSKKINDKFEYLDNEDIATAVPVPQHGRLGDLDELHKEAVRRSEKARTYDSWYNCTDRVISAFDIANAPTIIPADPAEEGDT